MGYISPSTFQKLLNQITALQKLWLISFIELLVKDNSVSIHKRTLWFLVTEIFKFKRGLSHALIKEIIPQNKQNTYKLRNNADLTLPLMKSIHKGLKSLS